MIQVTAELLAKAYDALTSGDLNAIRQYWAEDMVWLVPGHNQLSGWKHGLNEFLAFMARVNELSGNSFKMERIALLITDEWTGDRTHNTGQRAGNPDKRLDIDVIHVLRWRDGKIVEARGAIFGDGTAQYDQFWTDEQQQPLTQDEVKRLVTDWYAKLDVHAPIEELLPMLADAGLEMKFPEGTLRGHAGFKGWYDTVTRKFFDETHEMKQLDIRPSQDQAEVQLVVNWQAHVWNPPSAKSQWLGFDAAQRWIVKRSPASGKPVIVTYIVNSLAPMPGSAPLPGPGDADQGGTPDTRTVIDKYLQFVNAGDWEGWLSLFSDQIVMDEQLGGHLEGIEALRACIGGIRKGYSKFLMHPLHVVVQGQDACVIWHCEAANAAGVPIDARGANFYHLENGKITYFANFHDTVPFKPFTDQKLS